MQPVVIDDHGNPRFQENKLIVWMLGELRKKGITLNDFPGDDDVPQKDWEQFYQMIGYSVGGYCELSCVGDGSCDAAVEAAKQTGFPWQEGTEAVKAWKKENGYPVE